MVFLLQFFSNLVANFLPDFFRFRLFNEGLFNHLFFFFQKSVLNHFAIFIRWSSSSVTLLSFKAFKTRLFKLSPFEDARENNFSCFETFVLSFLLTEAETMETTPQGPANSGNAASKPDALYLLIDFLQIVGNLDKSKVPLRFWPRMWNEQNTDNVDEIQVQDSIKTIL